MKNLVLDIGNTFYKVSVFQEGEILHHQVLTSLDVEFLRALHGEHCFAGAILSTTRQSQPHIENYLRENIKTYIRFRADQTPVPIKNLYSTPTTLGADRLAAAVAAARGFEGEDVMIFDLGTAMTIDFVSAKGEYLGGNISLGYSSRLLALHRQTGRLPLLEPRSESVSECWGDSTASAMQSGVFNSVLYEIEMYMAKYPQKTAIFTGGEAKYFVKSIKNATFVDYHLVPKGLALILSHNISQGSEMVG